MSDYVVSARKYRPKLFDEVVGQESITRTLENAIANDHLAQAFLFCGPRGVGKTTCARILARVINEEEGAEQKDLSFNIFELDAASNNSVDDMRNLIDQVRIPPQVGSYRVFIIDEVHMLSTAAFNAFLKTLEEPPPHAIFILATTEKHKILPTILSRCQVYDFRRIEVEDMVKQLESIAEKEGVKASADALHSVAQKADGAMRDALSIFDQLVSFSGDELTYENVVENLSILDYDYFFKLMDVAQEGDISGALLLFNEIMEKGFDGHHFVTGLSEHIRDLLVCKEERTVTLLTVSESIKKRYLEQSKKWGLPDLYKCLQICNKCDMEYKSNKNPRLRVELMLMQLCSVALEKKKPERVAFKVEVDQPILIPFNGQKGTKSQSNKVSKPGAQPDGTKPESQPAVYQKPNQKADVPETAVAREPQKTGEEKKERTRLSKGSLSIKGVKSRLNQKGNTSTNSESDEEDLKGMPASEFSEQAFYKVWNAYLKGLKEEGKSSLHSTFSSREVKFGASNELILVLDNDIQEAEITEHRADVLQYLREELNNYQLQFKLEVSKTPSEKKRAYTNRDRFELMAEKNPALEKLRKRLDLDVGF